MSSNTPEASMPVGESIRKPSNFAHLHLHTEFSTLDGINRVDQLPEYIKSLGQDTCAVTEHGTLAGSYKFFKACKKAEIKPVIGIEAYYTVNDRSLKELDDLEEKYYHMVLLAQNNQGLHNLFKLSTYSYTEGMYGKPRMDDALLIEYNEGILATSACLGSRTSQLILNNRKREAEKLLLHHAEIFKDRFFIEVQLHEDKEQQQVNQELLKISRKYNLPMLLTNDCHYTREEDKMIHELALCMQTNDVMSNEKRFSFGEIDVHIAHHDWMWERAQKQGIPYEAIMNTRYIANLINSDTYFEDRKNRYPKYDKVPEGEFSWQMVERISRQKLWEKFQGDPPVEYIKTLERELKIIKKMGFYDYLLIVHDYVHGIQDIGIAISWGRGSAPGSLVVYLLGITKIDPVANGLIFDRWLNYGRAATPLMYDKDLIQKIESLKKEEHHGCSGHSH